MVHDAGKQVALGRVLVALPAVAWSTAGIFTKGVEADVWTVLLWRGLLAGAVMSAAVGGERMEGSTPLTEEDYETARRCGRCFTSSGIWRFMKASNIGTVNAVSP